MLLLGSCEQEKLEVHPQPKQAAYGQDELSAAVERYTQHARSPARYRELARTIAALAPRFNETVALEAERRLVFLAVEPLRSVADKPLAAQMQALATTLWPVALGVEPLPGEAPEAYAQRVCKEEHAVLCRQVVPEYRPLVLSHRVWKKLRDRAREALNRCGVCAGDDGYAAAMAVFDQRYKVLSAELAKVEKHMQPSDWPQAGAHAAPWSQAPVITVDRHGKAEFAGETMQSGAWRERLAAGRGSATVLGISLPSRARVRELRAILRDAAAAGFDQVALQVRDTSYPYPIKEYRLSTKPGSAKEPMPMRDADSIQILIEALDARAAAGGPPPSL